MYSNAVLNVFKNPQNAGRISKPDGIADCYNADNTAHVEFSLRIESGVITECKFRAQANPYIIAICSTMTNIIKGKMVSLVFLDPYSIKTALGDESDFDITFCIDCVKLALQDYKEKLEKEAKQAKKSAKNEENELVSEDSIEQEESKNENFVTSEGTQNEEKTVQSEEKSPIEEFLDDDFDFSDFFEDEEI